eukprot:3810111-Rhodomonas_salina.2
MKLVEAIRLGKATVAKISQNITIAIVSKALPTLCFARPQLKASGADVACPAASSLSLSPRSAATHLTESSAVDVGGMLVVTLNGASLLGSTAGTVQECVREEKLKASERASVEKLRAQRALALASSAPANTSEDPDGSSVVVSLSCGVCGVDRGVRACQGCGQRVGCRQRSRLPCRCMHLLRDVEH